MAQVPSERNQEATVFVGDLDPQVNESILWELMLQSGPVVNVHIPKDKLSGAHSGFGFVEFHSEEDADYAIKIMNMIKLYGKPIRVNKATRNNRTMDVGANLFIGNLDPDVDEKLLYDTFSAFGVIISTPKIMRDPDTSVSKGYAFISFDNFDSSDRAIEAMNGQYLNNRPITVSYALKKDTKGERHGTPAERLLAQQNTQRARPNQMFAGNAPPPVAQNMGMAMAMGMGMGGAMPMNVPVPMAAAAGMNMGGYIMPAQGPPMNQMMGGGMVPNMFPAPGYPGGPPLGIPQFPMGFAPPGFPNVPPPNMNPNFQVRM